MLYKDTVAGGTLELLTNLEAEPFLSLFSLAGGTALSLYIGHRRSVDLDLFSPEPFDVQEMRSLLEEKYNLLTDYTARNTLKGTIGGVKVDFITHSYPALEPYYSEGKIRLYSLEDITAMKLSAISDDGTRQKDFVDIAFLSTQFPFRSMLGFYERKYPSSNPIRAYKGVTYFADIDFSEDIMMLKGEFSWPVIRQRLEDMVRWQDRTFATFPLG